MYRDIIIFKDDTPKDVLAELKEICIRAHDDIAGKVDIKEVSNRHFVFEGEEPYYECLQLGYLELDESPLFRKHINSWHWEDEEPAESCDLLLALDI